MSLIRLLVVTSFFLPFSSFSQCDLELLGVDFYEGTFTIAFNNTNGCGGTGGPDGVSEIQIGFQALDPENDCSAMNQGWTFPSGVTIPDDNNHPGWVFTSTSSETLNNWTNGWDDWPWDIDPPYYTGDTITFPMYNQYQVDCSPGAFWNQNLTCQLEDALVSWIEDSLSIQIVIWQISYGPTMYAADGGWAEVGPNGNGTNTGVGLYEDDNFLDNWLIYGPCGEPFPEIVIDTVYVTDTVYVELPCDTVFITEIDTLIETIYDTTYVELPPDTIYEVDTLTITITEIDTLYTTEILYDTTYIEIIDTLIVNTIDTLYVELPPDTIYEVDTLVINIIDTLYVELPPDTVVITEVDTLILVETVYDTTYIELPPDTVLLTEIDTLEIFNTDTLYITETVFDTTYIELPADTILITQVDTIVETEYIYEVDTIYDIDIVYLPGDTVFTTVVDTILEFVFIEIDCSTGLPCSDLGMEECDPLTVYIPNTFTPNNDGLNDVWEVVLDPGCWTDIELKVFNRWGNLIWESYDPYYLQWNGSNMGSGYYVPDGVYFWIFSGRKINTTIIEELEGTVTVFR